MNSSAQFQMSDVVRFRPEIQTVLQKWVLQPLAERLTLKFANQGNLTPRHITMLSAGFGTLAALAFLLQLNWVGMLSFLLAIILDLVDGKLARLTGSGTAFGIILDAISDIYRVLIAALAIVVSVDHSALALLMIVFVGLHFGEFLVNQDIFRVSKLWKETSVPAITSFQQRLLNRSQLLKKYGLKLICLHYQERLMILFGFGAVTQKWTTWTLVAIVVTLLDYYFKYHFDLALIKQHLQEDEGEVQHA